MKVQQENKAAHLGCVCMCVCVHMQLAIFFLFPIPNYMHAIHTYHCLVHHPAFCVFSLNSLESTSQEQLIPTCMHTLTTYYMYVRMYAKGLISWIRVTFQPKKRRCQLFITANHTDRGRAGYSMKRPLTTPVHCWLEEWNAVDGGRASYLRCSWIRNSPSHTFITRAKQFLSCIYMYIQKRWSTIAGRYYSCSP